MLLTKNVHTTSLLHLVDQDQTYLMCLQLYLTLSLFCVNKTGGVECKIKLLWHMAYCTLGCQLIYSLESIWIYILLFETFNVRHLAYSSGTSSLLFHCPITVYQSNGLISYWILQISNICHQFLGH